MPNSHQSQTLDRRFSRRAFFIGGVQAGIMALLGQRMYELQINRSDRFRLLAEENRIDLRLVPPARGRVFDRNGIVLAENEQIYRISFTREDTKDGLEVLMRLGKIIGLPDVEIQEIWEEAKKSPPFVSVTVADRVSWEDISKVAVNSPALPGITPEVGLSRVYPLGHYYAHVVGYVGPVSDRDLSRYEDPDPVLRIPRFQIGKVGVEQRLEEDLRGKAGTERIEKSAEGRVMRVLNRTTGTAGRDLKLTIDSDLQAYVAARLGEESASAVVMDCQTGQILAAVSAPSFDPNKFVRGISYNDYAALRENKRRPLASKIVQDAYPPGSTFKMITALAALEKGVIDINHSVFCSGSLEVADRPFACWKRGGHGRVGFAKSLRESCDVFYYDIALKVGIEAIAETALKLGLGSPPDVPMSAITHGIAPDRHWKESTKGLSWLIGDTVNASIGQGYVLASPLQLAIMTARLASGKMIEPTLVQTPKALEQPPPVLDFDPRHLRAIRDGMEQVVNNRKGTGYASRVIDDNMRLAGKTGTSQVRNISQAERRAGVTKNEDLPWERRDHSLFVNYAPLKSPKIAVSVVVEHGGSGSKNAAPIARDISLWALHGGAPPLKAYPAKDRKAIQAQQERISQQIQINAPKTEGKV